MTDNSPIEKGPNFIWRGELFRLTVFFQPQNRPDASVWWDTMVGEPPEQRNLQPKAGTRHEEGPYHDGRLVLSVQVDRADWIFIPAFDPQTGSPALDELPEYDASLTIFREFVKRWFEICPPTSRLAFGNILDYRVPDRPTGYRFLAKYLHGVQLDPDNSSDFHYQINRRRSSKNVPGLFINRLSKWSVLVATFTQFALGPIVQELVVSSNDTILGHLELDINTVPENQRVFSSEQLPDIFSELVELAREIAEKGDVP